MYRSCSNALASRRGRMKILVIEDEARILSFLARGLEGGGYRVGGASDGRDGLARAVQGEWDLVLLDLMLPGLNGLDVLDALHRSRPELPVLILSARADLPTKLRGFDLGASDYVSKAVSFDEVLARVRVQLRRSRPDDDANSVRGCRLVVDLAPPQARLDDVVCDLSDREFRLLHHLVLHAGEVISRERLLAEVWGYSFDPGSNVVEVCVRRLRKKLGPDAPIETVRYAGYRLAA